MVPDNFDSRAFASGPKVVVHDPAASGPHDLDDPFYDAKIQSRLGDMIARGARKEPL
jgi:hypothetical protein